MIRTKTIFNPRELLSHHISSSVASSERYLGRGDKKQPESTENKNLRQMSFFFL